MKRADPLFAADEGDRRTALRQANDALDAFDTPGTVNLG